MDSTAHIPTGSESLLNIFKNMPASSFINQTMNENALNEKAQTVPGPGPLPTRPSEPIAASSTGPSSQLLSGRTVTDCAASSQIASSSNQILKTNTCSLPLPSNEMPFNLPVNFPSKLINKMPYVPLPYMPTNMPQTFANHPVAPPGTHAVPAGDPQVQMGLVGEVGSVYNHINTPTSKLQKVALSALHKVLAKSRGLAPEPVSTTEPPYLLWYLWKVRIRKRLRR